MEAAENNHLDAVKYLIKAGALVDPKVRVCRPIGPLPRAADDLVGGLWAVPPRSGSSQSPCWLAGPVTTVR